MNTASDNDEYIKKIKEQKWKLIPEFLRVRGLVKEHIDSYNYFVNVGLKQIVLVQSESRYKSDFNFGLKYVDAYVGKPVLTDSLTYSEKLTTPMECRARSLTYSAPILVDVIVSDPHKPQSQTLKKGVEIGRIPVMLRSSKCILASKSEDEMAALQECPYDPGGYFIVNGIEKVILTQEQLSKNRILLEIGPLGTIQAAVTSSTNERKSRCLVIEKHGKFYLGHNVFSKDIPIIVVFRAMGIESDQEILSMIGIESNILQLLESSLEETFQLKIFSQNQALDYIGSLIKPSRLRGVSKKPRIEEARDTISQIILSHIPITSYQFFPRAIYIGYMVRQIILAKKNPALLSDKDYYGNKRLELAGNLLSLLFEEYFKIFNDKLERTSREAISKQSRASEYNIVQSMSAFTHILTEGFKHSISSGNWNVTIYRMERKGITETLNRLSYIAALGQMTRVNSHMEKTQKISGPRALQPSHWGMICPSDTPEGAQCGLVKNLALLAHITLDGDDETLMKLLYDLGVEEILFLPSESIYIPGTYVVLLNGVIIGVHRKASQLVDNVKYLRRNGYIGEFVSIYIDYTLNSIQIASDGGRVCRPLIIVDKKTHKSLITTQLIDELSRGVRDISSFIKQGYIEYVDVNEENSCNIVLNELLINNNTTHVEIDPVTILGIVSALIPFPNHNQSPRNTYQCAMGKQAIGTIGFNQQLRIDVSPLNIIVYPQCPMVRSRVLDLVHFMQLPAGQNAILGIMSYSGYDIEDAVILNKGSLDRGYGRVVVHKRYQISAKSYQNTTDRIVGPPRREDQVGISDSMWSKQIKKYHALSNDGIVDVGEKVEEGDILVNMESPQNPQDNYGDPSSATYRPSPLVYKEDAGVIGKVMLTTSNLDKYLIKIHVRDMRRPELGDKYSSRHGQKGVVGLIVNQEDFPFNDQGICPDMIMNPHGFPSRMTVGKLMELITGKAGLFEGKTKYGTAFGGDRIKDCSEILISHGFSYSGKDMLYSGITGELMMTYIFMGPIYYQRLKHMVKDKVFARPRGPRVVLTRQPTQGRAREGGLRVGEMERDCLVAHGASLLLVERLLVSSDPFLACICTHCGLLVYKGWCQFCKSGEYVNEICIPYACKLLFQELTSMNIVPRFTISKGGYFNYSMVENKSFAK